MKLPESNRLRISRRWDGKTILLHWKSSTEYLLAPSVGDDDRSCFGSRTASWRFKVSPWNEVKGC